MSEKTQNQSQDNRGTMQRDKDAKTAFKNTNGSYGEKARASARAFASGNKWAEENARAVGNCQ
jgi:hypothetical protein